MYRDLEPLMVSTITASADPIPGTIETVERLRKTGIRVGSTTGYSGPVMKVLQEWAARHGFAPDAVVCSTDVPAGRPAPHMCHLNTIRLGVYPFHACIKVGDTPVDIEEGLNAGMWTVGVTRTGSEVGLPEAEVAALPPEILREKLQKAERRLYGVGAHYVIEGVWETLPVVESVNQRLARGERP